MNKIILSNDQIRFINWLILMVERSGLSCDAHEGKFMIRHISGLPLSEEVLHDVLRAIADEASRLSVPIDACQMDNKIWLALIGSVESEN